MTEPPYEIAEFQHQLDATLVGVSHSSPITNKYRDLERYLASRLGVDTGAVYTAFISKAANVSVRLAQSPRALKASFLVALIDPPPNERVQQTITKIENLCLRDGDGTREVLALVNEEGRFRPVTVIAPSGAEPRILTRIPELYGFGVEQRVYQASGLLAGDTPSGPAGELTFSVRTPNEFFQPSSPFYPFVFLVRDDWNDFGFLTKMTATVYLGPERSVRLGEVKVLQRGQNSGVTPLPDRPFRALGRDYCSLGQGTSYYEMLRVLPPETRQRYLLAMRDVVADSNIAREFSNEEGFEKSLLRTGSAVRAFQDAHGLLVDRFLAARPTGLAFSISTDVGGDPFNIVFKFNQSSRLPDRINAIIGYNGTGKTHLLAKVALIASADLEKRTRLQNQVGRIESAGQSETDTRFGAVLAVSYSAFDTFAIPSVGAGTTSSEPSVQDDALVGYRYLGLRQIDTTSDGRQLATRRLKSIDEVFDEFRSALSRIALLDRSRVLSMALAMVENEPSFQRIGLDSATNAPVAWESHFESLSTGHKIVLNIIVQVLAYCEGRSLVLLDEPESHLHPSLLAAMIRSLNYVLEAHDSFAIVATHSPVVLQEIPRRYVHILQRFGRRTMVRFPTTETFGENVGYLASNVFDLDSRLTDYHSVLESLAYDTPMEQIEELFDGQMSGQARAYVRGIKKAAGQQ